MSPLKTKRPLSRASGRGDGPMDPPLMSDSLWSASGFVRAPTCRQQVDGLLDQLVVRLLHHTAVQGC